MDYTQFSNPGTPNADLDEVSNDIDHVEETAATEETTGSDTVTGIVANCARLNVRQAPSAKAKVACVINEGTEVLIDEDKSTDDFYKVYTATGAEGFCMKAYIAI